MTMAEEALMELPPPKKVLKILSSIFSQIQQIWKLTDVVKRNVPCFVAVYFKIRERGEITRLCEQHI